MDSKSSASSSSRRPSQRGSHLPQALRPLPRQYKKETRSIHLRYSPRLSLQNDIKIRFGPFPSQLDVNTWDFYIALRGLGYISCVDIFQLGSRQDKFYAAVTFSRPGSRSLWTLPSNWGLRHATGRIVFMNCVEPVSGASTGNAMSSSTSPHSVHTLKAEWLDFGVRIGDSNHLFIEKSRVRGQENLDVLFVVDFEALTITIFFPRTDLGFKLIIPFRSIGKIYESTTAENPSIMTLTLNFDDPPQFFRMRSRTECDSHAMKPPKTLNSYQLWRRVPDLFAGDPIRRRCNSLSIENVVCGIDIGRWTTYRLGFHADNVVKTGYESLKTRLSKFNIIFEHKSCPRASRPEVSLATSTTLRDGTSSRFSRLQELESAIQELPFSRRYLLEVCISQNIISEYAIDNDFLRRLSSLSEVEATNRLDQTANRGQSVEQPSKIFRGSCSKSPLHRKMPPSNTLMRSVAVTPTKIVVRAPTREVSNRVTREYSQYSDRFLRVHFTDDKPRERLYGRSGDDSDDLLYDRIYQCLCQGIIVGGRRYEFLAYGNSQIREHGAFFFASDDTITASDIRDNLGDFSNNPTVSKYAARVGQCFSTTRAVQVSQTLEILEFEDVEYRGRVFTDGVGKISSQLAVAVAVELNIPLAHLDPPSLFQFRLGGSKGTLAVAPELTGLKIGLRRSQYKFHTNHENLEIIKSASFAITQLNRQLITCLISLGVPDSVFLNLLRGQLRDIDTAMRNESAAARQLRKRVDPNHMTLTIADIVDDGFLRRKDPFVVSLIQLWRSYSLKYLKEKAAITVDEGAFLLGCTDDQQVLQGWYRSAAELSTDSALSCLPEIFLRISSPTRSWEYRVVTGVCIVARNPSLHAGDIRVVMAVDKPELYHLKNVVVFPQSGDRDIPSMCSGGDLDGDDFFVSWMPELIPCSKYWNEPTLDEDCNITGTQNGYTAEAVDSEAINDQMMQFFVKYMKFDNLGRTATCWQAHADLNGLEIRTSACRRLAQLHSQAVDFPKTGIPADFDGRLRVPKWPHYMDHGYRKKGTVYKSKTVLGQLYDEVEISNFVPNYDNFISEIMDALPTTPEALEKALEVKLEYDESIRRIMVQHEIRTEFEIWSTLVLEHSRLSKDYQFHQEIGAIASSLKATYKALCIEAAGGDDYGSLGPFLVAMYTVTAQQVKEHLPERQDQEGQLGDQMTMVRHDNLPLISFPWLFHRELGHLANGRTWGSKMSSTSHGEEQTPHLLDLETASAPSQLPMRPRVRQDPVEPLVRLDDTEKAVDSNVAPVLNPHIEDLQGLFEGGQATSSSASTHSSDTDGQTPETPQDSETKLTQVESTSAFRRLQKLIDVESP